MLVLYGVKFGKSLEPRTQSLELKLCFKSCNQSFTSFLAFTYSYKYLSFSLRNCFSVNCSHSGTFYLAKFVHLVLCTSTVTNNFEWYYFLNWSIEKSFLVMLLILLLFLHLKLHSLRCTFTSSSLKTASSIIEE